MAIANAGSRLRELTDGQLGLTASVGDLPIGDLVSIVHNYDEREYTSNGVSRWFLNIGDRTRLNSLIHGTWLDRPRTESVGGNYGHPTPKIGYDLVGQTVSMTVDAPDGSGPTNRLSTFTIAEFLKRLVMHREDPEWAMPYLEWADVETLLYGAETSESYAEGTPQGMQADTAVYIQQAIDSEWLNKTAQGQWRIFSKLGFGYARGGEFVNAGYGCFPVFDDSGELVKDWGKEFFIVTQYQGQSNHHESDARVAAIYRKVVQGVLEGTIK
jgi:hypothetical protein